ncbi:MAG: potassium channel family protein [Planctomycetota bacterium]|jgi:hypothetical protein
MKYVAAQLMQVLRQRRAKRNIRLLLRFFLVLIALVTVYSTLFHYIMMWEGREHSWLTGFYWTLTVMSTLGFGDITFESDLGRFFSMVVLVSGIIFLLILLPFTIIQFFYAPWVEAQAAARAPRELPADTRGHVILTHHDPVTAALIRKLEQFGYEYVLVVPELDEAMRHHDLGLRVAVGQLDNPETYRRVRAEQAVLGRLPLTCPSSRPPPRPPHRTFSLAPALRVSSASGRWWAKRSPAARSAATPSPTSLGASTSSSSRRRTPTGRRWWVRRSARTASATLA